MTRGLSADKIGGISSNGGGIQDNFYIASNAKDEGARSRECRGILCYIYTPTNLRKYNSAVEALQPPADPDLAQLFRPNSLRFPLIKPPNQVPRLYRTNILILRPNRNVHPLFNVTR